MGELVTSDFTLHQILHACFTLIARAGAQSQRQVFWRRIWFHITVTS